MVGELKRLPLSTGEIGIGSQISAQAGNGGNTGDISITTQRLIGQDGALISTFSSETGSSGSIQIQAQQVLFDDEVLISSGTDGAGNGGDITVETEQIRLLNNSVIFSGINFNESEIIAVEIPPSRRGGTVFIKASESIDIDGEETSIFTGISEGAIGNGGNLIIETGSLTVSNRASLSTGTQGNGNAGFMNIQAENIELTDRAFVIGLVSETGVGNGANITIETENLTLRDQAQLFTTTGGNGNAGSVNIQAENIELTDQSSILADVSETGVGNGGTVTIDAEQFNS